MPAAILGSETLDAAQIDAVTVTLARAPVATKPNGKLMAALEDVNDDDRPDLVVHFETQELNLKDWNAWAFLRGKLKDGRRFKGKGRIRVVK